MYLSIILNVILIILCTIIYLNNIKLNIGIENLLKEINWYKEIFLYYKNENEKLKEYSKIDRYS